MKETPSQKLQRAYRQLFLAPDGSIPEGVHRTVLQDLARFCGANKPPTKTLGSSIDVPMTFQSIGRKEVWEYIQAMANVPIRDAIQMSFEKPQI